MRFLGILVSVMLLSACGEDKDDSPECPEVVLPVIIDAVNVKLFDVNNVALNVCDAILTIDSSNGNQIVYGSALNNCSERFSLAGGYDLKEHDLLIEKAGYMSQAFKSVVPTAIQCGYETLDLNVYLVAN